VAFVTWGTMVPRALAAAETLAAEGIEAHVLDLRWLNPLDEAALVAAAEAAGGRVIIAHEAVRTGGFAGEIALRLSELMGPGAALNVVRVTTPDVRMPSNAGLQASLVPQAADLAAAARLMLKA
jgi:2-oxoisovalerate dehydrogenase E1 component